MIDMGDGTYRHNYELANPPEGDVQVVIYDIDWVWVDWQYGWIEVETPSGWYYEEGPTSRFVTDSAGATVGWDALPGFSIRAATPVVGVWDIEYTDLVHDPIFCGSTSFPLPEPASGLLLLIAAGLLRRR